MSETEEVPDDIIGHDHVVTVSLADGDRPVDAQVRDHTYEIDDSESLPFGGNDEAPSSVDYMVTGLAGCQLAVLTQALRKARIDDWEVEVTAVPDEWWREEIPEGLPENLVKRIEHIDIEIDLSVPPEDEERAQHILEVYDQGCVVGQSFREGVEYTPETSLSTIDE